MASADHAVTATDEPPDVTTLIRADSAARSVHRGLVGDHDRLGHCPGSQRQTQAGQWERSARPIVV